MECKWDMIRATTAEASFKELCLKVIGTCDGSN